MQTFKGGCHCGNISYVLEWPLEGGLVLRECSCSFCTKQGVVYTAHPQASLSIVVRTVNPTSYEFDTRTAYCDFCPKCGIYVYAHCTIDERKYAVLNANTISDFVAPTGIRVKDFQGETTDERLSRRSDTWIGTVSIEPPLFD